MFLDAIISIQEVVIGLIFLLAVVGLILWSLTRKVVMSKSFVVRSVTERKKKNGTVVYVITASLIVIDDDVSLPAINDWNSTFEIYVSKQPLVKPGDIITMPI